MITLTLTKSTMVLQWYAVSIGYNNINNNNLIYYYYYYYYYAVVFMPQASSLKLLAHLTTEVWRNPTGWREFENKSKGRKWCCSWFPNLNML